MIEKNLKKLIKTIDKHTGKEYNTIRKKEEDNKMKTLDFFAEWTTKTAEILDKVAERFPLFMDIESVEMNYVEVTIQAREEDIASIERMIAEIV